jgi:CubicO group peptidase (beta-lactamase class C family)
VAQGQAADVVTVGCRDLFSGLSVERDTIFRIASMTKPVTTVAGLMLFDERRFELDEPIITCVPEFARMRVLRTPEGPLG